MFIVHVFVHVKAREDICLASSMQENPIPLTGEALMEILQKAM